MKEKIVLIGGGGHCKALIDVIEAQGKFTIVGIVDTMENLGRKINGYEVIGTDDDLRHLVPRYRNFIISVGHIKSNALRKRIYEQVVHLNGKLPTIVSPSAYVSKYARLSESVVVLHHVVINSHATIGCNTIVNTASVIEHDCTIGNHCHVAPHTTINGGCLIGDDVLLGSASVIIQGLRIGDNSIVGAGSVVIRNVDSHTQVVGNPARKIKNL